MTDETKILEAFAKWYNETQWKGGKNDFIKSLFCKCDYKSIVEYYLTGQTNRNASKRKDKGEDASWEL